MTFTKRIGFEYVRELLDCYSPYGIQLAKKLIPYTDKQRLEDELCNISSVINAECHQNILERIGRLLMPVKDIRRSIQAIGEGTLDEVSLFEIKRFLLQLKEIRAAYYELDLPLKSIDFPDCTEALSILCIDGNCSVGFFISDNYSDELKAIRTQKRDIERLIRTAQSSEITDLKLKRLAIADREATEETRIRAKLSQKLLPYKNDILYSTELVGALDLTFAKARLAKKLNAKRPVISGTSIELCNMTNPLIANSLNEKGRAMTPVTIKTESGSTVITGANMGGKSVALKTLALNAYTAMCGMYVFCESATLPFLSGISMIAEDSEDTENGLSSFGGEIVKLKHELAETDHCKLLLFDELARGTNPQEGAKIVRSVVKYLNDKKAICIFATHYDGVAEYAKKHYRVIGLRDFDFESIQTESGIELIAANMNYGLYEVENTETCPREAIGICKMLLRDEPILDIMLNDK